MSNELKVTFVGGADHLGDARSVGLDASVLVGRSHKAGIRFTEKDRDVSGVHLEIRPEADGVYAVAVKEYVLNERDRVAGGEMRKLAKGDVLTLGPRSRAGLRIDALPTSGSRSAGADEAATGATRFTSATGATRFTSATGATRVSLTDATHASLAGATGLTSFGDAEAMRPTRFADGESVAGDAVAGEAVDDGKTVAMDRVTRDSATGNRGETEAIDPETLKRMMADAATASGAGAFDRPTGAMTGMASDSATSDSVSTGAGIDKTIALPQGGQETINIAPSQLLHIDPNAPKRFRKRLMAFSIIGFAAILGVVIYSRMNHAAPHLSHPKPIVTTIFKGPSGASEIQIDYPKNERTTVSETSTSVEVMTVTGKDRDCPFHLDFSVKTEAEQLKLSLEESVERECAALVKKGYSFNVPSSDNSVSPEERAGYFFFEDQYPGSCQGLLPRGTRLFRREYTVSRGREGWWGVFIMFRDGDRVYRLLRDIPEHQKPRGRVLLLVDPNLALFAPFLGRHWESSGISVDVSKVVLKDLLMEMQALIDGKWPGDWARVSANINTMMIMTYGKHDPACESVVKLRKYFEDCKDALWRDFEFKRDKAIANADEKGMKAVGEECRSAFGADMRDWRFKRSNDAKEWPWQKAR